MTRKFSTTVLDTLLKTVEVEFKVPLLGFGEIKFPVSEYAKDWWKDEKAREELLQAIETAEDKFVSHYPDNKAAQILRDFSLRNEEDFQKVIAELLNHLDEQKITWLMADKLGKGFERIVSNEELQRALTDYLPILQNELGKIREFREVISYLLQKQIAGTTSRTYETTKEIKGMLEQQARDSSSKLRVEKTVFISYRRTNLPWALAIYQELTHQGFDVFFDYLSIPSGDFEKIIIENIKARAHFVVILTPSALERCNESGDWLRREIETAMDEKRNIVPLMLESFDFGAPSTIKALTGKLERIKKYNGLRLHSEYFFEGMNRLREQYLNVSLDTVTHPISENAIPATEEHQTAASGAPPVEKEQLTAQEWFERGYRTENNVEEEIRCYTEAIKLDPNLAGAYTGRGLAYSALGKEDEAMIDFDTAIKLQSNDTFAYLGRGILRRDNGDLDGAIRDFDEAIRLNPELSNAYYGRGNARHLKNDLLGALADYNKSIHLEPDEMYAYFARAFIFEANKDYEPAIADYQKYLDLGGGEQEGDQKKVEEKIKNLKRKLAKKKSANNKKSK